MKTLSDLLLLGDPRLYEVSRPVEDTDLPLVKKWHVINIVNPEMRSRK